MIRIALTERRNCKNIMSMAELLKDQTELYDPIFLDWRGRMYSKGEYINYQSHKTALALLRFSKELPITDVGIYYLKCYGASLYGVGTSNETRVSWVEAHQESIQSLDIEFIRKAKNIPLFVAFCMEYKNCFSFNNPAEYRSSFPVIIDCTCNGMQHIAAMMRDVHIAHKVNLMPSERIEDLYTEVAKNVTEKLQLDFELTRKMVKKVVMTVPYNVTLYSATEYFVSNFVYVPQTKTYTLETNPKCDLTFKALQTFSAAIYKAFFEMHPALKQVVAYFKAMADLLSEAECPITWHTPSGMRITQSYISFETVKTKGL